MGQHMQNVLARQLGHLQILVQNTPYRCLQKINLLGQLLCGLPSLLIQCSSNLLELLVLSVQSARMFLVMDVSVSRSKMLKPKSDQNLISVHSPQTSPYVNWGQSSILVKFDVGTLLQTCLQTDQSKQEPWKHKHDWYSQCTANTHTERIAAMSGIELCCHAVAVHWPHCWQVTDRVNKYRRHCQKIFFSCWKSIGKVSCDCPLVYGCQLATVLGMSQQMSWIDICSLYPWKIHQHGFVQLSWHCPCRTPQSIGALQNCASEIFMETYVSNHSGIHEDMPQVSDIWPKRQETKRQISAKSQKTGDHWRNSALTSNTCQTAHRDTTCWCACVNTCTGLQPSHWQMRMQQVFVKHCSTRWSVSLD